MKLLQNLLDELARKIIEWQARDDCVVLPRCVDFFHRHFQNTNPIGDRPPSGNVLKVIAQHRRESWIEFDQVEPIVGAQSRDDFVSHNARARANF